MAQRLLEKGHGDLPGPARKPGALKQLLGLGQPRPTQLLSPLSPSRKSRITSPLRNPRGRTPLRVSATARWLTEVTGRKVTPQHPYCSAHIHTHTDTHTQTLLAMKGLQTPDLRGMSGQRSLQIQQYAAKFTRSDASPKSLQGPSSCRGQSTTMRTSGTLFRRPRNQISPPKLRFAPDAAGATKHWSCIESPTAKCTRWDLILGHQEVPGPARTKPKRFTHQTKAIHT